MRATAALIGERLERGDQPLKLQGRGAGWRVVASGDTWLAESALEQVAEALEARMVIGALLWWWRRRRGRRPLHTRFEQLYDPLLQSRCSESLGDIGGRCS